MVEGILADLRQPLRQRDQLLADHRPQGVEIAWRVLWQSLYVVHAFHCASARMAARIMERTFHFHKTV